MKFAIHALLLFTVSTIYSQNTIEGSLKDSQTNTVLPFVNVYLPQLEKGTISNEDGTFILKNIPSGQYDIIISSMGYQTLSQTISIPVLEQLLIILTPTAIEMEEIIISTPFHKLQSDNVMKVEKESIKDLKASGAITLADGITNIAGVESISTGLSIGKPVIRGLSSNRVLVYTQGIRLENQQFGDEHGLGINDAGIESIEVIKGPASLLYGSDALGGVLYINPEHFAQSNTQAGDVSVNYFSNTQGFNTNAGYKLSGENFKFLFRGSIAEHADYKTKNYRVTNTRFKEEDFKAGIGYQISNFKTAFRYNINHSKLGIPVDIGEQSTSKTPLLPFQDITNHIYSWQSTLFFEKSRLNVNLGFTYNNREEFEEKQIPALHMKLKTFNYDVKYNLPKIGKFETIVGVQGMDQTNTNYGEEQLIPDARTNDFGILATSHIHFNKADVQLGARFDNRNIHVNTVLDKTFNSFNGALGIKTNVAEKTTARLNLASGFRAPNLAELTSNGIHEGTNRYEIGNPNLDNEQNLQVDLAIEFKNEHLEVFANAFYNKVNDYIFLSPNGEVIDENPVYLYLQENAKLYGGEFGVHIHPHPLDWLHFESSFETVTGKQDNGDYLPLIPANSLTNVIRVEFNTAWIKKGFAFVKLRSTFNQNKVSDFETETGDYNVLSAGFGGDFTVFNNTLSINVSGNNLSNKMYINHLSRLKPNVIYNIGRNISLGLTYTL